MIQSRSDSIDRSLFFSPVKENSTPSKAEMTCRKVMGAFLIVFGILSVCAFTACVSAAIIMGSAPLAIGAAAVGLLGIGVLISSTIAYRTQPEEYLFLEDLVSNQNRVVVPDVRDVGVHPYVSIVHVNNDQNQRPSVPQYSSLKRPSSGRMQVNIPRAGSDFGRRVPSVQSNAGMHVIPGSRVVPQGHVQDNPRMGTLSGLRGATNGHVQVGSRS